MIAHVIDDRCFVRGLTELFRDQMQRHEVTVLLPQAELVVRSLDLDPISVPIEGYYSQSPQLTKYFLCIRSLQQMEDQPLQNWAAAQALAQLRRVFLSPAMGRAPKDNDPKYLLPRTTSPLDEALAGIEQWDIDRIVQRSRESVRATDAHLIAVAATSGDPVALCVARETMALEAALIAGVEEPSPGFYWHVSMGVSIVAQRFIDALAMSTGIQLPKPEPTSAEIYWQWASYATLDGRCIAISVQSGGGFPFYHWYVVGESDTAQVIDFWSNVLWTTADMVKIPPSKRPPRGTQVSAPALVG